MKKNKVIIIGLDGGEFEIINHLIKKNKLPNLKRAINNGSFGKLESTKPPLTPCAWSSFMTGKNPGKHGIYDFYFLDKNQNLKIYSAKDRKDKDLWQILSENNLKSIVFNVPMTYPAHKINGIMISDFTTPNLESKFTYPPSFKKILLKNFPNYKISEKGKFSQRIKDQKNFEKEITELLELRFQVFNWLLKNYQWDLAMVVFGATDHICHWYWQFKDKKNSIFSNSIYKIYENLDNKIGNLFENFPQVNFIFMSDHGFGSYQSDVNLNYWLMKNNYLFLKKRKERLMKRILKKLNISISGIVQFSLNLGMGKIINSLPHQIKEKIKSELTITFKDFDWEKTKAYSFGYYGSIYINQKVIKLSKEKEKLIKELKYKLNKIKDEKGKQLVDKIWLKKQLYSGRNLAKMPDLIFSMQNYSYACSSSFAFSSNSLFSEAKTYKSGDHRKDGIFITYGPNFVNTGKKLKNLSIMDITPTILHLYGVQVPQDMDGKVIK